MIGARAKRARVPRFEEALAKLSDELALTETFAGAMVRDGNYKAALAAIDEQRERVHEAERLMLNAFRPRWRRAQVAIAGIAAVLSLAGASFAALSSHGSHVQRTTDATIRAAEVKIQEASRTADDRAGAEIVSAAISDLSAAGNIGDSEYRNKIRQLLAEGGVLTKLLRDRAGIRLIVGHQVVELAKKVEAEVADDAPSSNTSPQSGGQQPPPPPPPPATP